MGVHTDKLLDRDLVRVTIKDYRARAAPVLALVVDEGIATFERCSASATGRDENLGVLFPALHVFEMLDGVDILLREGAVAPARALMRSAFEAKLTVEYVTERDGARRGAAYVVAEIHRRIRGLERWDPATQAGKELIAEFMKDRHAKDIPMPTVRGLTAKIRGLRQLLQADHLKEAGDEYARFRAASGRRPEWHALWGGPAKIQQLARHLGRGGQYEILYRPWSRTTHGLDLDRQLTEEGGAPAIRVFRDPTEIRPMYSLAISFGLETIRALLDHYRPDEVSSGAHARWYTREVRPVFQALGMAEPEDELEASGGESA